MNRDVRGDVEGMRRGAETVEVSVGGAAFLCSLKTDWSTADAGSPGDSVLSVVGSTSTDSERRLTGRRDTPTYAHQTNKQTSVLD